MSVFLFFTRLLSSPLLFSFIRLAHTKKKKMELPTSAPGGRIGRALSTFGRRADFFPKVQTGPSSGVFGTSLSVANSLIKATH